MKIGESLREFKRSELGEIPNRQILPLDSLKYGIFQKDAKARTPTCALTLLHLKLIWVADLRTNIRLRARSVIKISKKLNFCLEMEINGLEWKSLDINGSRVCALEFEGIHGSDA